MEKSYYRAPEINTFKLNVSRTYMLTQSQAEYAEAIAQGILDGGED